MRVMTELEAAAGCSALSAAQPQQGPSEQQREQPAHSRGEQRQPATQPALEQGAGRPRGRPREQQGVGHAPPSPREAQGPQHEGAHALAEVVLGRGGLRARQLLPQRDEHTDDAAVAVAAAVEIAQQRERDLHGRDQEGGASGRWRVDMGTLARWKLGASRWRARAASSAASRIARAEAASSSASPPPGAAARRGRSMRRSISDVAKSAGCTEAGADSRPEVHFVLDDNTELDDERKVCVGVCALSKKARSKQMTKIRQRLTDFGEFNVVIFGDDVILHEPVEQWPLCDCLISFFSEGFPLEKAEAYARLRRPFLINDLAMQHDLLDRRRVYDILQEAQVPVPPHVLASRDAPDWNEADFEETEDSVRVGDSKRIMKPFVEKPVSGEDHNVYIYFPPSAGGGCKKLFRKKNDRSSEYFPEVNRVRRDGAYIYESFLPTGGTDVKVYTLGPNYAHAEARKSPVVDGRVLRTAEGKEVRFPVLLNPYEKEIARAVTLASGQMVCGFDLLRSNGRSYVCDVNGWSFVKSQGVKYYDDAAGILRAMMLAAVAPHCLTQRPYPQIVAAAAEQRSSVDGAEGGEDEPAAAINNTRQELRCVLAVIRHGDRTPKQKMKATTRHPKLLRLLKRHGGKRGEAKLKTPEQLQELLEVVHELIAEKQAPMSGLDSDSETGEGGDIPMRKLQHLCFVLEQGGHFSGINRKVQIKPLSWSHEPESDSGGASSGERGDGEVDGNSSCYGSASAPLAGLTRRSSPTGNGRSSGGRCTEALLVLKHGGVLTPKGRAQAEFAGRAFRASMYTHFGPDGGGLLRLHSTYRHDLKIYSSDEGRVQMSAAAFVQGLLDLEGSSLTPILVSLVKKDASMLDAFGKGTSEKIAAAKALLYDHLTQAREPSDQSPTWSHSDWRMEHEANRDGGRARRASIHEGSDVGRLPPNSVALLHRLALQLNELVARLEALEASEENPNGTLPASGRTTRAMSELAAEARAEAPSSPQGAGASGFGGVPANGNACNEGAMASGSPTRGPPITSSRGESGGLLGDYDRSRKVESLLLVSTRWSKLCNDFFSEKKCAFNLSKVPDIFDMARYDLMHNNDLDEEFVEVLNRVLATVEVLAACVIPHEYGVTPEQKLSIGSDIAKVLLGKLVADMLNTRDESLAQTPESAEREREFENPLAALLKTRANSAPFGSSCPGYIRGGSFTGGRDSADETSPGSPSAAYARSRSRTAGALSRQGAAATAEDDEDDDIGGTEGDEDSNVVHSGEIGEEDGDADHRLNAKYAVDISTPARHVRSRIYFTSESHVHALVNVLRFATNEDGQPLLKQEARQILDQTDQLDYLTHIVFRLFEDMNAPRESAARFRLQVLFSPGAAGFDVGGEQQKLRPVEPLIELPLEYLAEDEGFFFRSATSLDDFVKLASPHQKPWPLRKMRKKQKQNLSQQRDSPFMSHFTEMKPRAGAASPARAFIVERLRGIEL